jgi:hypothetical protein
MARLQVGQKSRLASKSSKSFCCSDGIIRIGTPKLVLPLAPSFCPYFGRAATPETPRRRPHAPDFTGRDRVNLRVLRKLKSTVLRPCLLVLRTGSRMPSISPSSPAIKCLAMEPNTRPYVYQVGRTGFIARWRGSALAWPLIDARLLLGHDGVVCALHRKDSFLVLSPSSKGTRVAAYRWDGFGFDGISNKTIVSQCNALFGDANQMPRTHGYK